MSFGVRQVAPYLPQYTVANPEVTIDMNLNDRIVDLVEEGFDVAIRIAKMADSSLISRKVAEVQLILCASPEYVATNGAPRMPEDLLGHRLLGYSLSSDADMWRLYDENGTPSPIRFKPAAITNSGDALSAIAAADGGIANQPDFIVNSEISAGRLIRILPEWRGETIGVHVLHASRQFQPLKVRSFIDWISKIYRPNPPWVQICGK
jgi:DNA-binding transcriptional LysR family regulator